MSELLPCPFCGGEIETHVALELPDNSFSPLLFCCHHCGAMVSFDDRMANVGRMHGDDSPAIKLWNTRYERTCTMSASVNALGEIGQKCSACEIMNFRPNGKPSPYCPWCGAKVVDE